MWRALTGAAVFTGVINLLALTGPLFMLEVYDRVIPSGSVQTLTALLLLVAGLYAFSGFLDVVRGKIMSRIAGLVDAALAKRVIAVVAGAPLRMKMVGDSLKPVREADQIRQFLSSSAPATLFDLPWMPVYLAICFFLHPLIGWLAVATLTVLVALTVAADLLTRGRMDEIAETFASRNRLGEAANRNGEAIAAMGILPEVSAQWSQAEFRGAELQRQVADISGLFSGMSKTIRQMVQSGSLALGAWLVIHGDMTGGSIIAASIIVARTLQPIEQVIANWRGMMAARQAWQRLESVFALFPEEQGRTILPAPVRHLHVEGVFAAPPGERRRMTVHNVGFQAQAGTAVGIIGPSASGKSSLVRTITGVWPAQRGRVCLDGAALDQWTACERGRHIGYMPQSSDLFPGTVAQNIARLDPDARDETIIAAARAAGAHDMIVALPDGYETQVGDGGVNLSAGQRQRVALARALYGDPFLLVLDEPNSNLDLDGDKALAEAIARAKARGAIVIVVAHRNSILSQIDMLLVMEEGSAKTFGPRDAVLKSLQQKQSARGRLQHGPPARALTVIEGEGGQS